MSSWWKSSKNVIGGERMDMIVRIRNAIERMEKEAEPAVKAETLSNEAAKSLSERAEEIEKGRDASKTSIKTATSSLQGLEASLSSETSRGQTYRTGVLDTIKGAVPQTFDAAPILEELGYQKAVDAAKRRRSRKDKLERMVRPGTTVETFDARWGIDLRACPTAKAPPAQRTSEKVFKDRTAVLSAGWQMPEEGRAIDADTQTGLEAVRSVLSAVKTDPVRPEDAERAAAEAERHPGRPVPHPLFQPVPVIPKTDNEGPPQCLRERADGTVDAAECNSDDREQLWGRVGLDLVGYAHGTELRRVQNVPLDGTMRDGTGRTWPFIAPAIDPVRERGLAFSWAPGVRPEPGTMVLRRGAARLVFNGGRVPQDAELCLGVLAVPCRIQLDFTGTVAGIKATATKNSRVWQSEGESSTWTSNARPATTAPPGNRTNTIVIDAPDGRLASISRNGRVQGEMEGDAKSGMLQWVVTGGRDLRLLSVRGYVVYAE